MKIVFDCERMKYPYTGLFEYCHQLGLSLIKTKNNGDEVSLYVRQKDQHNFDEGTSFIDQNSLHKFIFPPINKNIDLWHTTHQISSYLPSNKKLIKVLTVHDLNFLHEEKSDAKRKNQVKKHQKVIDKVDHIIAISEFTKEDILKHLKVNKPITVIYNGAKVEKFPEFNQPKYRPKQKFLFSLGTVIPKKNFHTLPCLLEDNDFELIIAGKEDGGYADKIREEAIKHGVQNRVHLVGPVSSEEKYWYYNNCSAFLFPSLAEGFGIPAIEAMNFGKPVFLSKLTSLPEIGGELAYYFDNFENGHMKKVFKEGLADYEKNQPADAIIAHAQKFNWEQCAEAHWKLYHSLMR